MSALKVAIDKAVFKSLVINSQQAGGFALYNAVVELPPRVTCGLWLIVTEHICNTMTVSDAATMSAQDAAGVPRHERRAAADGERRAVGRDHRRRCAAPTARADRVAGRAPP